MRYAQLRLSLAAVLLAVLAAVPAHVRGDTPEVLCNVGTIVTPKWVACSGLWAVPNDVGDFLPQTLEQIKDQDAWKYDVADKAAFDDIYDNYLKDWTVANFLGHTGADDPADNPFDGFVENSTTQVVTFKNPYLGVYVLILKGGAGHYMYLLDFREAVTLPIQVAIAQDGKGGVDGKEISHLSLWGEYTTVPEPSSMLLLASGLLGLGFVGYRRRRM